MKSFSKIVSSALVLEGTVLGLEQVSPWTGEELVDYAWFGVDEDASGFIDILLVLEVGRFVV